MTRRIYASLFFNPEAMGDVVKREMVWRKPFYGATLGWQ